MKAIASISISAVFALGAGAAIADEAKPASNETTRHIVAQAPAGSVQVAQAAGGAAGGASTGGIMTGVGVAGSTASTIVFVGSALAGLALSNEHGGTSATVTH
jgi:hypothetical protein